MGICIAPTRPTLQGGFKRWEQSATRVTHQTGNHNERSRTATSRSQQQIGTKRWFTATRPIPTPNMSLTQIDLLEMLI
jgi:hypothetical protein